jgi:hypothetical protein
MRLSIHLRGDFDYRAGVKHLPVIVEVHSEEPAEVATRVQVNSVFLENEEDEYISYGFDACITSMLRDTMTIGPEAPYSIEVDALEDDELDEDEDAAGVPAGKYRLSVRVTVWRLIGSGDFKPVELTEEIQLVLTA